VSTFYLLSRLRFLVFAGWQLNLSIGSGTRLLPAGFRLGFWGFTARCDHIPLQNTFDGGNGDSWQLMAIAGGDGNSWR